MRFVCPGCNGTLEVSDDLAGSAYQCERCGQRMRVPERPASSGGQFQARTDYPITRQSASGPEQDYDRGPDRGYDDRRDDRRDDRYDDRRRDDYYDDRRRDDYDDYDRPRRRRTQSGPNGMAIAAMVCGIIGLVLFCIPILAWIMGALGIIFGSVAMNASKDSSSRGMATAGIVCGAAGIVIGIIIFIIALSHPVFWWGR